MTLHHLLISIFLEYTKAVSLLKDGAGVIINFVDKYTPLHLGGEESKLQTLK